MCLRRSARGWPHAASGGRGTALSRCISRDGRAIPVQVLAQRTTQERIDATRHYPDQDEVDSGPYRRFGRRRCPPGTRALTSGARLRHYARASRWRVRVAPSKNRFVEVTLESNGAITLRRSQTGTNATWSCCAWRTAVTQAMPTPTVRPCASGPREAEPGPGHRSPGSRRGRSLRLSRRGGR